MAQRFEAVHKNIVLIKYVIRDEICIVCIIQNHQDSNLVPNTTKSACHVSDIMQMQHATV